MLLAKAAEMAVGATRLEQWRPSQEGYRELRRILDEALQQAAQGKGAERHADGRPWHEQPIIELARYTGPGGPAFQAMKKIREALRLYAGGGINAVVDPKLAAKHELLGAIVYAAACIKLIEGERNA